MLTWFIGHMYDLPGFPVSTPTNDKHEVLDNLSVNSNVSTSLEHKKLYDLPCSPVPAPTKDMLGKENESSNGCTVSPSALIDHKKMEKVGLWVSDCIHVHYHITRLSYKASWHGEHG